MTLQLTLDFLSDLEKNNSREWFHGNKKRYQEARSAFENLIVDVLSKFDRVFDIPPLHPKDAIFRINRDVRFSKDKSPYNTNMSAVIGPNGRKSLTKAFYISVAPHGRSMAASGGYALSSTDLHTVREAIVEDARPLRRIIESDEFVKYFEKLKGDQLKTAPRGFSRDHPDIDLLRYKAFMAEHAFTDADVVAENFPDHIIEVWLAAKPLTSYLDQLLGHRTMPTRGRH